MSPRRAGQNASRALAAAPARVDVPAPGDGYVQRVDALALGLLARDLGAGRATKEDTIDPAVGLVVHRKAGDRVRRGAALSTLHLARAEGQEQWRDRCAAAFTLGAVAPQRRPLIHAVVD